MDRSGRERNYKLRRSDWVLREHGQNRLQLGRDRERWLLHLWPLESVVPVSYLIICFNSHESKINSFLPKLQKFG